MFRKLIGACVGLAMMGMAGTAHALVITYDESVDGDLPALASLSPVFTLDIGTNTFSGEISFSFNASVSTDRDSFAFSVPNNTSVVGIFIDIALLELGAGIFNLTTYVLQDSSFAGFTAANIPIPSLNLSLFSSTLPLAPSLYGMQLNSLSGSLFFNEFRTAAYTFSIEVAPAPEPSTLALFATGLALLAFLGWRRRVKAA